MSLVSRYPLTRPNQIVNFNRGVLLNSDVRFSRGSAGTYIGSDGLVHNALPNQPRFTHDPVTGENLGLLIEGSATNFLYPSTPDFTSGSGNWSSQSAPIIPNAGIAPDGTNTAVRVDWSTVSGSECLYYDTGTPTVVGITEVHSFFLKPVGTGVVFYVVFQGVNWSWLNGTTSTKGFYFDFDSETFYANTGTGYGEVITKFPNGWYRISIPAINNGTGGAFNTYVSMPRNVQVGDWYIWGVQRENGSFPTSYIPTTSASVTRAADTISIPSSHSAKSGKIIFTSLSSSPTFALTSSDPSPPVPYKVEFGAHNSVPYGSVSYNSVRQGTSTLSSVPTSTPPSTSTLSFNFDKTTGALDISTTASDDDNSRVVSLPAELSRPAPDGYELDLLEVNGSVILKEAYLWSEELSPDKLASVSGELRSIGQDPEVSIGFNKDSDYIDVGVRPTLDLRFAKRKDLFDDTTEQNLITFSRGSIGTYVDENGVIQTAIDNEPRFDHDPETGESLGLLVEEARTNEMSLSVIRPDNNGLYTQWTPIDGATIQPYAALAPDGTFTAALVTFPNSGVPRINRQTTVASGTRMVSCWVRAKTGTVTIRIGNNSDYGQDQTIGTEWTRIVEETPSSSNFVGIYCSSLVDSAEFYAWGFQQEAGSFPTSYIPTPATFTSRSTSATYYDANGVIQTAGTDVARDNAYFPDENGIFHPAGLLLEGSSTNRFTYSDFGNAIWNAVSISKISTNNAAPDGSNTAVLIGNATGSANVSFLESTLNVTGSKQTFTFYAKATTTGQSAFIDYFDAGTSRARARISLDDGNVTYAATPTGDAVITSTNAGNGWWRCQLTLTPNGTSTFRWRVGNNASGDIYVWGAQLETGSYPTSYIPTSGSQGIRAADVSSSTTVTRVADEVSITGSNFSSWYNQSEGTWAADLPVPAKQSSSRVFTGGTEIWADPAPRITAVRTGSSVSYISVTHPVIAAAAYNSSTCVGAAGGLVSANVGGTLTAPTQLIIGRSTAAGVGYINVPISRLTYWPRLLPEAILQTLTSTATETWDLVFDSSLASNGTCAIITNGITTYEVDWGDGTPVQTITATGVYTATHTYVFPTTYKVKINVVSGAFRPYYNNSAYAGYLIEIRKTPDGWTNTSTSGFGLNLTSAWYGANRLKSIDREVDTSGVTGFSYTWQNCSSLTSFPANMFNTTGNLTSTAFTNAFLGCALTAQSIENILTSLDTNGRSNITLGISGGTNASKSTWSSAANTAYNNLIAKGWTISYNT